MTCRHGHEHCPVCAGVNGPTPPVATAPIGFTPSVDPHCAPISKTEYEALTAENTALKQRITELEAWQLAIAEGTGFCNRAEGQSGYEVADPQTILDHFQGLEFTALTLADDVVTASRASEARLREYLDSAISSLESNLVYLEAHVQASRLRQGSKRIATCADAALEGHKQNIGFLKAALDSSTALSWLKSHDDALTAALSARVRALEGALGSCAESLELSLGRLGCPVQGNDGGSHGHDADSFGGIYALEDAHDALNSTPTPYARDSEALMSELRSQLDALGARLAGAESTAYGLKLERDVLNKKLQQLQPAFLDQSRELGIAIHVLEDIHPDCAMEYRYRAYPGLHQRPEGFVMPSVGQRGIGDGDIAALLDERDALKEEAKLCRGMISAQEAMIKNALEPLGCGYPFDHHAAEWAADQIGGLKAENAALTARVQALEGLLHESMVTHNMWRDVAPAISLVQDIKAALNSTPAADLAAHDERVKREVVEKIVKAIKEDGSPWSDADTAKLCEKSGISPSTETPTQEPKP